MKNCCHSHRTKRPFNGFKTIGNVFSSFFVGQRRPLRSKCSICSDSITELEQILHFDLKADKKYYRFDLVESFKVIN